MVWSSDVMCVICVKKQRNEIKWAHFWFVREEVPTYDRIGCPTWSCGWARFGAKVYEKQLVTYSTAVFSFPSSRNSWELVPSAPVLVQTQVVCGQIHWQLCFGGPHLCMTLSPPRMQLWVISSYWFEDGFPLLFNTFNTSKACRTGSSQSQRPQPWHKSRSRDPVVQVISRWSKRILSFSCRIRCPSSELQIARIIWCRIWDSDGKHEITRNHSAMQVP